VPALRAQDLNGGEGEKQTKNKKNKKIVFSPPCLYILSLKIIDASIFLIIIRKAKVESKETLV